MDRVKRQSIEATYDSRETGPRYHVTASVNDRTVTFMEPMPDPFHHTRVVVGWRDLVRSLLRRRLEVVVMVGADPSMVEDVMELDDNYLGSHCTRRDEFRVVLGAALETFANQPDSDGTGTPQP